MKGQTLHHKTVSCGSKLVIFTSVEWQVIPQVLFSFAPYSSASPLLADLSSGSQQNASAWRNACWSKGKIGSSENRDGYQHQLARYPQSKARPGAFSLNSPIQERPLHLGEQGRSGFPPKNAWATRSVNECGLPLFQRFLRRSVGSNGDSWTAGKKENWSHSFQDKCFLFPHTLWIA